MLFPSSRVQGCSSPAPETRVQGCFRLRAQCKAGEASAAAPRWGELYFAYCSFKRLSACGCESLG